MTRIDWADLRARHPLSTVARRYGIAVPADSGDITIRCPMPGHDDTIPSMILHLDTERYHCFGCGAHGDVIQWTQDMQRVTAVEAVRILDADNPPTRSPIVPGAMLGQGRHRVVAGRAHPERPKLDRTPPERIRAAVAAAWAYYSSPPLHRLGTNYLNERRINVASLEAEIDEPVIGHTPRRLDQLVAHLRPHGFAVEELIDASLANHYPDGGCVDFFRQRAIVPVRDSDGRLAGLIGRTTSAAPGPKYLNMSRTHTYDKASVLYRPTTAILDPHANVIVCEGTLDALAVAAQAAISRMSNRFAPATPSGLALSDAQLAAILAIHPLPPVFAADGDTSGQQATVEWATRAALAGRESVVTEWPDGHDPASWIAEHGEEGLVALTRKGCLDSSSTGLRPKHCGEVIIRAALADVADGPSSLDDALALALRPYYQLHGSAKGRYVTALAETLDREILPQITASSAGWGRVHTIKRMAAQVARIPAGNAGPVACWSEAQMAVDVARIR